MSDRPTPPARSPREWLRLLQRDRAAAAKALAELPLEEQVALVCEAPVDARARLLDLVPEAGPIVARMPEAELCFTIKAVGLESASWILELATPAQIVAALDLDVWSGDRPDLPRLEAWLAALSETGDESLLASLQTLDPELLLASLMGRIAVFQKPEADDGWQAPPGTQTLEGAFYFGALREADDLADLQRVFRLLFERDYWAYFRLLQGVIWESLAENEEWALRWRNGRLEDLGFPAWGEAIALYNYLDPGERAQIPDEACALGVEEWSLPVWLPRLPGAADAKHSVFRALAALDENERRAAFFAFVSLANKVAVADRMDLGDAETTPSAIDKAARWASLGLEHLVRERGLPEDELLRRVPLERLFRIGANLDPEAARPT